MKKNEILTFVILAINFVITGLVVERQGIIANNWIFFPLAILGAFALTKYVFNVSKRMGKDGKK